MLQRNTATAWQVAHCIENLELRLQAVKKAVKVHRARREVAE